MAKLGWVWAFWVEPREFEGYLSRDFRKNPELNEKIIERLEEYKRKAENILDVEVDLMVFTDGVFAGCRVYAHDNETAMKAKALAEEMSMWTGEAEEVFRMMTPVWTNSP